MGLSILSVLGILWTHILLGLIFCITRNSAASQQSTMTSLYFSLGLINAWSIVNKAPLMHDAIQDNSLDVLAVTETFVYDDSPDVHKYECAPAGFSVIHKHRQTGSRGGGLALIYNQKFRIKSIDHGEFRHCEVLPIRITNVGKGITVVVIYRPPSSSLPGFIDELDALIGSGILGNDFIICGDLNCPGPAGTKGLVAEDLAQVIQAHGLRQHIHEPTCRSGNILDHLLTQCDSSLVTECSVKDVGISDHYLITASIRGEVPAAVGEHREYRCWKHLNMGTFRQRLRDSCLFSAPEATVDGFCAQLRNIVTKILDDLIPVRKRTIRFGRNGNNWLSTEAVKAKRARRKLERQYRKSGCERTRKAYRRACKTANKLIIQSRRISIRQKITETGRDPKMLWRTVNDILHRRRRVNVGNSDMCGKFSGYLMDKIASIRATVAQYLSSGRIIRSYPMPKPACVLTDIERTTVDEVSRLIQQLPNKTSPLDYINVSVLKECSDVFAPLLSHLANLSFSEGKFPSEFKEALVIPLLKKPTLDANEPCNYRPISNLQTIGKILEKLYLKRILPHSFATGNFNPFQSAYRKKHNTETALLKVLDDIYRSIEKKNTAVVLVGLDISAAFDTVEHTTLLDRLHNTFGVRGTALSWLKSYLHGRTQFIQLGATRSSTTPVTLGVPQGSVLGPFLFSAYTSPISNVILSLGVNFHQYADDTQIYAAVESSNSDAGIKLLENCCTAIRDWFAESGMLLNPEKSEVLLAARKSVAQKFPVNTSLNVAGCSIQCQTKLKSLGVTLDSNLSFNEHVQAIVKACNYHIRAFRHIRHYLDQTTANTVACSIVTSRLDYCNSLLHNTSQANLHRLQRVQNNLARAVMCARRSDHITPILRDLHWLPIQQRISYKVALITHRAYYEGAPEYLSALTCKYQPTRDLRSSTQSRLSKPSGLTSRLCSQSFSAAAERVWNSLPEDLRSRSDNVHFKRSLKTHYFKDYFDSTMSSGTA